MNKIKISLILVFVLLLNFIFCPFVKAETFSDLDDILAVWDSNIDTSWDTVFNEYKTLDPQTMDKADTVIASNMFRYLMSVGSKPKGKLTQTDYSNFVKAISPFYIAYHGITSAPEVTVHAAWSISSDAFKIFCANVIHNLAQQSTYYDTHVLKNDNFLNDAGKGHLNFIYNDIDNNTEINIANNIFNGFVLSSSGSSISDSYYFNPTPQHYTGPDIRLSDLFIYSNKFNIDNPVILSNFFANNYSGYGSNNNYLYLVNDNINYVPLSVYVKYNDTSSSSDATFSLFYDTSSPLYFPNNTGDSYGYYQIVDLSSLAYPISQRAFMVNYNFPSFSTSISRSLVQSSTLKDLAYLYFQNNFNNVVSPFVVYTSYFRVHFVTRLNSSGIVDDFYVDYLPSNFLYLVSPQFVPVNIYNNQVYTSSEDTYWHVDQMVDNIINNDYSTVNNGTDNTFYINNYYVPETVSSGGIQLVTSSSIVYNYTTIINNNGTSSGGSIGSYPYPFDVRIINPEDLQNETELNIKNDILNNYDIDLNAGDINSSINIVKDTFNDRIRSVAPSTGGAMSWGPLMFSMIPSDWSIILWSFIIIMAVICVYHHRK